MLLQMAVRLGVLEQAVDVLPTCTLEYQNKVNCPTDGMSSSVVHSLSSVWCQCGPFIMLLTLYTCNVCEPEHCLAGPCSHEGQAA